ncbi:Rne/Rng family ribonuclease [Pauljensenia sp. UMB0018B]|uniref:Ribonuclease E n=2 Tax=Actinomycetaceae TaxID=2049 RepID=A0A2I1I070_9ACTO|nr:Rne/Rng family ribonuclease [Schaalia odontolytica]MDK7339256.1 Rne/Rng family ribonuclease [Pauljensenia sp. UMB0018B]PKY64531.1 RNA-binding protein [Schaalia odontolytica]
MKKGASRHGVRAHHWRIVTTESTPVAPAASLLFQAPVFQAAPEVAPAAIVEDQPEPKRRRKSATVEEDAPREEAAPKRRRRSKKAADEAEAADISEVPAAEEQAEEAPAEPKTRRRRRSKKAEEASTPAEDGANKESASADESDSSDDEESSTRRRRRRRARSSSSSSDEGGDPADQVQALKGSTRLEAKKMRRREGRREGRRRHTISESEFLARRESVERTMVIRDQDGLDQIAILEDGLLVEHYVARRTQSSMVGNIYLGRVQNVLPSMEAAFVDVGRGRNAVLYAGEVNWDAVGMEGKPRRIEAALKSGDPVLVQVTKDPIGHKGARLTSQITLAGRYLVLIPGGSMMGISRKLPDKERARLKKILKAVVPSGSGVIVRTAAEGATEEQIRDDVARLTRQWEDIEKKRTNTKSAPTLLRGEPELAVRVVRDIFNEDFSKLVIEGRDTYATVKEYVDELSPELSDRVEQWVGTEDVFHAHRIDEQLAKGMDRKVWLPSGGTLIIDRTEAMTVIDVNTGKFIGAGGTLEETVTRNNLEAAEEIVRQLRLRDIGGIVIIDFVDMVLESNRDLVLRRLVECLGRDRTRHQVTEITSLGLVQMTRKRVGEGLVEAFSSPCEACEGRGFIVHQHPVETSGAEQSSKGAKGSKKQQKKAEPRRIEDNADHERAKEALSAIAAASTRKEEESAAEEPTPTKKRRTRAVSTEVKEPEASAVEQVEAPEAPAEEGVTKRPRRRRRVAESAPLPELPVHIDLPEPVDHSDEPAAPAKDASEIQLPEHREKAPATRRRASRTAATASSEEPAEAPAPKKTRRRATAQTAVPEVQADEAPATAPLNAPAVEEAPAQAPAAPRKTRKRRAAVSTGIVEPDAAPAPVVIDLPARAEVSAPAVPTKSTDDIALPEASDQPRVKRRRRAVSTGIVDAG